MALPMIATSEAPLDLSKPIDVGSPDFSRNKYAYYPWILEEAPICAGKISVVKLHMLSRYDDCVDLLKDPRFVRNRTTATGGSRMPFAIPLPKSVSLVATSMIVEDDPAHRRLRSLVNQAFKPGAIARIEQRIERLSHELLDQAEKHRSLDLMPAYCLPIPATVISELVGVADEDTSRFAGMMKNLSTGMTGWNLLRTFLFQMPGTVRFVRELVARKRGNPQEDILTGLIEAEANGERLTEDEIVAMVFLLVVAGYETTVHLITNGVLILLQHPDQLERLREQPELMDSAVEEILRHRGPVHGTKLNYATEDVTFHGVTVPKGSPVIPLLGAANHDPRAFDDPEVFDIARAPNRHLSFGHGNHFCLGAQLARMETKVALATLLERNPNLRLAVDPSEIEVQNMPFWHRHQSLPVVLG
jgi:cytochrome P450